MKDLRRRKKKASQSKDPHPEGGHTGLLADTIGHPCEAVGRHAVTKEIETETERDRYLSY